MIFNSTVIMHTLFKAPSFDPISLSDLQQGETAVVGALDLEPSVAEHLMNLGLVPGIEVTVAQSGPGGDPRIYRVDGTAVALRRNLADGITVRQVAVKKDVAVAACDRVLALTTEVSAD